VRAIFPDPKAAGNKDYIVCKKIYKPNYAVLYLLLKVDHKIMNFTKKKI
jgi:hypothetical protein